MHGIRSGRDGEDQDWQQKLDDFELAHAYTFVKKDQEEVRFGRVYS